MDVTKQIRPGQVTSERQAVGHLVVSSIRDRSDDGGREHHQVPPVIA
jgi:hypothetical protein